MFCPNCGQQIPDNSYFCPVCGKDLNSQAVAPAAEGKKADAGFAAKIRKNLSSTLFLVMCILMSVAVLFSFTMTTSLDAADTEMSMSYGYNLDIISVLILIGMWIAYAKAKSSDAVMNDSGIKLISGTITASWVLNWIAVGMLGLCGIAFAALSPVIASAIGGADVQAELDAVLADPEFWSQLEPVWEIYESIGLNIDKEAFAEIMILIMENAALIFMGLGIGFIVGAVVLVLVNVFYYGNLRRFSRNLSVSYNTNKETDLRYGTVSTWLLVVGILSSISGVSTLLSFGLVGISGVAHAALLIVASIWIKKLAEEDPEDQSEDVSCETTVE